eukprot:407530_1
MTEDVELIEAVEGVLQINVIEAHGLQDTSSYTVTIHIQDEEKETSIAENSQDPQWKQQLYFLKYTANPNDMGQCIVKDKESAIHRTTFPLPTSFEKGWTTHSLTLDDEKDDCVLTIQTRYIAVKQYSLTVEADHIDDTNGDIVMETVSNAVDTRTDTHTIHTELGPGLIDIVFCVAITQHLDALELEDTIEQTLGTAYGDLGDLTVHVSIESEAESTSQST